MVIRHLSGKSRTGGMGQTPSHRAGWRGSCQAEERFCSCQISSLAALTVSFPHLSLLLPPPSVLHPDHVYILLIALASTHTRCATTRATLCSGIVFPLQIHRMGPTLDARHLQPHLYSYPPSPPNSTNVTAPPSPRFRALQPSDHALSDKPTAPSAVPRRTSSNALESASSSRSFSIDPEPSFAESRNTQSSVQISRKHVPRRPAPRALTLPSSSTSERFPGASPPKTARPLSRRSSRCSTDSSSSSSSSHSPTRNRTPPHSSAGIGRKVADSLQLFKESASSPPSEEFDPLQITRVGSPSRRRTGSYHADDVGEARFEFVKRSDWTEREAAAIRRERSATALDRVYTKESMGSVTGRDGRDVEVHRKKDRSASVRDTVMGDLAQWRKDVISKQDNRGRPRERPQWTDESCVHIESPSRSADSLVDVSSYHDLQATGPFITKRTRQYPPSPSPSRSPDGRIPPLPLHSVQLDTSHLVETPTILSSPQLLSERFPASHSRSPTPIRTPTSEPAPDYQLWSTDDESTWDTTSITTNSTTSASSPLPLSPSLPVDQTDLAVRWSAYDDDERKYADYSPNGEKDLGEDEPDHLFFSGLNLSQDSLPHVPLRPFRNQVGGHNSIYKFTKRAVCKVRVQQMAF